jgi:hypothetical protein
MKIESPHKTYETSQSSKVVRIGKDIAGVMDRVIDPYQNHKSGSLSHEEHVVQTAKNYRATHYRDYHSLQGKDGFMEYVAKDPKDILANRSLINANVEESGKYVMKYQDVLEADARKSMERSQSFRKAA